MSTCVFRCSPLSMILMQLQLLYFSIHSLFLYSFTGLLNVTHQFPLCLSNLGQALCNLTRYLDSLKIPSLFYQQTYLCEPTFYGIMSLAQGSARLADWSADHSSLSFQEVPVTQTILSLNIHLSCTTAQMLHGCNRETEVGTQFGPLSNWQGPFVYGSLFSQPHWYPPLFSPSHSVGSRGYQAIHAFSIPHILKGRPKSSPNTSTTHLLTASF